MRVRALRKIISLCLALSMIIPTLSLVGCKEKPEPTPEPLPVVVDPIDDNYRTFYQIFVGSFSDASRDGVGDLRGVINRLDYLNDGNINSGKSLGVQGIWLSPIFSSPSYHKYDAQDYYKIDWRFGTEEDLVELAEKCEERNVKLILDLAINHTSNKNEWFVQFEKARKAGDTENKYYDYYTAVTEAEKKGGVAYQKIVGVDCWYECNFSGDMPELNFDNPEVREEMLNVARHYLDLGVDGFRFDAIKYIYYGDTKRSAEFWEWYMSELRRDYPDIYCVGECWSGDNEILEYYGSMNCFAFAMSQAEGIAAKAAMGQSLATYTNYIVSMQNRIAAKNPDGMLMPFLSNHDMDRIAGAFILENNMRMAANLYLLTPGSPIIYYGEEIGIRGSRGSANTDANRRLAMLWGDPEDLVKDPTGTTYSKDNQIKSTVYEQIEDESSLYNYYRELIAVRHRHPEIARGVYSVMKGGTKNLGGFIIEYEGEKTLLLHNNSSGEITVDLSTISGLDGLDLTVLADYVGCGAAKLEGTTLTVGAYTSVILK